MTLHKEPEFAVGEKIDPEKRMGLMQKIILRDIPEKTTANPALARKLFEVMVAGAPNNSLHGVKYTSGVQKQQENLDRVAGNNRLGLLGTPMAYWHHMEDSLEGDPLIEDPHYQWTTNRVVQPWNNLSVGMHELGHAIDFNDYRLPENRVGRALRNTAADVYRMAPLTTLWKEHAAWRKGQNAFVDGAMKKKVDPEFVKKVLHQAAVSRPNALGTYWGGGIGGTLGLVGGAAGSIALQNAAGVDLRGRAAALLPLLGAALGGVTGVYGGARIGNKLFANSNKAKVDKLVEQYAKYIQANGGHKPLAADKVKSRAAKSKPAESQTSKAAAWSLLISPGTP